MNGMKKIGVISDTHVGFFIKQVPKEVFELFDGVDLIIHAGDLTDLNVIIELEAVAPLEMIAGNNDDSEVGRKYGYAKTMIVDKKRIFMIHDLAEINPWQLEQEKPDCIIFGHTHMPESYTKDGVLYFNPGSATMNRKIMEKSIGILTILEDEITGEIIYY